MGDDVAAEGLSAARRVATEPDRILSLAAAGSDPSLPLLGRGPDVRQLSEALLSGSTCVLITGVRGVGRSRILGQAVATLLSNEDDVVVLGANGSPVERHTPFGGLGQLLNDELLIQAFTELGQPETEVIRRALPVQFETEESHVLATLGGPGSYLRIARAVSDLFQRAFGNAEVFLAVDDLDQFDRSSVEVVTRLTSVCGARLLAAWCTEGSAAQNEILFRFQGMAPDILPLRDLALTDAERLARAVSPDLGVRDAEDIARLSGGRPGRIVELIRALEGSSVLSGPMGPSVDELLRRRIRELDETEQQVLVYMAVGGGRMAIPALGSLMGMGILETSGHARRLQEAGLVRVEGSRAAVIPGLLIDFVTRELPAQIRKETHSAIVAHLLKVPDRADPGAVGHHLLESDRPLEAAAWFRKAGLAARDRTAYVEAISYLEKGMAAEEGADPDIAKELGALHAGMGDFKQSIHWYGRARVGYVDRGDRQGDVEAALEAIGVRLESREPPDALFQLVHAELRRAEELRSTRLTALALDVWLNVADYAHSSEEVSLAKDQLKAHLEARPGSDHLAYPGTRLSYLGHREIGLELARRVLLTSRETPAQHLRGLNRYLLAQWVAGRIGTRRGLVLMRAAATIAAGAGDLPTRFSLLANSSSWYMDRDQWESAELSLDAAERLIDRLSAQQRSFLAVNRAIVHIRRGAPLLAEEPLDELDGLPDSPRSSARLLAAAIRVIVRLEQGRLREAIEAGHPIAGADLRFPFSSDLSLVAEAQAELMRRTGSERAAAVPRGQNQCSAA
jgi:tetratricopeptide (TPR) repeat protein